MIEPIMYIAIGFLVACMLVIGVIPLVHARAVRLTMRRIEAVTPMSMAEIQADKDQLRAEFAMATRRLEMTVEQLKAKTASQLAEIGQKSDAISRLKLELSEKSDQVFALEARDKQLQEEITAVREELAGRVEALAAAERAVAETKAELTMAKSNLLDSSLSGDSQRVELATVRTQAEVLKGQVATHEKEVKELYDQATRQKGEIEALNQKLAEERAKSEKLGNAVDDLERRLVAQTTEAEIQTRRVGELLARLDEQAETMIEREQTINALRSEASIAAATATDLRARIADMEKHGRLTADAFSADKELFDRELAAAQAERSKAQGEITAMKRELEVASNNERKENAVLRERISEVAAEIARLTSLVEGPGSPINGILAGATAGEPRLAANGSSEAPLAPVANGAPPKGSLADRIRTLQSRAARAPRAR
jgi:chromosome segregation ATPase